MTQAEAGFTSVDEWINFCLSGRGTPVEHTKPIPHSVWLCPGAELDQPLREVIAHYANHGGAGVFAPHLTLLGDLHGAPQTTVAACHALAEQMPITTARIVGVSQTAGFFMSLFLDVEAEAPVLTAQTELAKALGVHVPPAYRPHLSLAYGLPAGAPGPQAIQDLEHRFVGKSVTFGTVVVVHSAKEVAIKDWRILQSHVLR